MIFLLLSNGLYHLYHSASDSWFFGLCHLHVQFERYLPGPMRLSLVQVLYRTEKILFYYQTDCTIYSTTLMTVVPFDISNIH